MKNSPSLTSPRSLYYRPLQTPDEGELWTWARKNAALKKSIEQAPKRSLTQKHTQWFSKLLCR